MSQHVWDRLNTIFWSAEVCQRRLRILWKNVFCSIKLLFELFLWTAKMKMEFLGNFSPIVLCSNLFSKLFAIGEKLLQNPFSFLQFTKKDWNSIFWSRIHFFGKRILFRSQTFWGYSKLVGTLCKSKFICWKYKLLNTENTLLFNVSYAALNQS